MDSELIRRVRSSFGRGSLFGESAELIRRIGKVAGRAHSAKGELIRQLAGKKPIILAAIPNGLKFFGVGLKVLCLLS